MSTSSDSPNLKRSIGLKAGIAIVIGSVVGSSIFMKPALMAGQLGSPILLIIVWVVAGLLSILGAMCYAELGAMFPSSGGQYVYLQKMYGNFVAYLFGWAAFAVINTGGVAAIAYIFSQYTEYFFHLPRFDAETENAIRLHVPFVGDVLPLHNAGVKVLTIILILILTVVNCRSVKSGAAIQYVSTLLKVLALIMLVFGLLFSGKGDTANLTTASTTIHLSGWNLVVALVAATSGAFAAYDGWSNVNMVAGELKDPQRNIVKSLLIGLFVCMIIYVLITISINYILPIDAMASSSLVASDATEVVMGPMGAGLIALLIMLSTFGTTNVTLLASSRITYAMGRSGSFFKALGNVHPKFHSPANAILMHGIWSSFFVITGSFDILTEMFVFIGWLFYGLTVAGLIILRKKLPAEERPYKVWPYPLVPIVFVLFTIFYLSTTLYNDISNYNAGKAPMINSALGLIITLCGVPLYFYFRKKQALPQE